MKFAGTTSHLALFAKPVQDEACHVRGVRTVKFAARAAAAFSMVLILGSGLCGVTSLRAEASDRVVPIMPAGTGPVGGSGQLAREVLEEMNFLRTDPDGYIAVLEAYRAQFEGNIVNRPGKIRIQTSEGVAAVDEAIRYLRTQRPMPPLEPDRTLALAAGDHVQDQGMNGIIGHYSSDGWDFGVRVSRRGGEPYGGENISYGYDTAREVIIQLLVDDNIADRGHRVNLFRDGFVRAGVGCGPHRTFAWMCVIDYGYPPVGRRTDNARP